MIILPGGRPAPSSGPLPPTSSLKPSTILPPYNLHLYSVLYSLTCIRTDPQQTDRANSLTMQRLMTEPHGLGLAPTTGIAGKTRIAERSEN